MKSLSQLKWFYLSLGFFCGAAFFVGCGGGGGGTAAEAQDVVNAVDVNYTNAISGLAATNVQAAIDEIVSQMATTTATNVAYDNSTSGLAATDLQAAVDEVFVSTDLRLDALEGKLARVTTSTIDDEPAIVFTDVNIHVRNGNSATFTTNGRGNIIVGYQETRGGGEDVRTGSHNVIIGRENNYSSYGGLCVGFENDITGSYSSVSGGNRNQATGSYSSVAGGYYNIASAQNSTCVGGNANRASNTYSTVAGGVRCVASGTYSSVCGGNFTTATGSRASAYGGSRIKASGNYSVAIGGSSNEARGFYATAVGGSSNNAGVDDWSGDYSVVCGGENGTTSGGDHNVVVGGLNLTETVDNNVSVGP